MEQQLQLQAFGDDKSYQQALSMAQKMCESEMLPASFKGKPQNILLALDLANRSNVSPMMIMQNLHIIQGRPSFSSPYIIASINSHREYGRLRYKVTGKVSDGSLACVAYAKHLESGEDEYGPEVTLSMAKAEGWLDKTDKYGNKISKWLTMPELMIRYRAAAFFGRLYVPEVFMGMHTTDEIEDLPSTRYEVVKEEYNNDDLNTALALIGDCTTIEELTAVAGQIDRSIFSPEQLEIFVQAGKAKRELLNAEKNDA